MKKRDRVFAAIRGEEVDHVPCGFSLHFPPECASGDAAIEAHLRFFKETDTDIIKIMNENLVPDVGEIRTAEDWKKIPSYSMKDGFMQKQMELTEKILAKADPNAFSLGTLHGICASAIHPIEARYGYEGTRERMCAHLRELQKVCASWQRATKSLDWTVFIMRRSAVRDGITRMKSLQKQLKALIKKS